MAISGRARRLVPQPEKQFEPRVVEADHDLASDSDDRYAALPALLHGFLRYARIIDVLGYEFDLVLFQEFHGLVAPRAP